jgi:FkbM family methyltransferase
MEYYIDRNIYVVNNYHLGKEAVFRAYANCLISNSIKQNVIWEPHMHQIFDKYITKNSIVIEAGCHIGSHSIKLAKMSRHLHAFEPMPISNAILRENIIMNEVTNVTLYRNGLSNKSEIVPVGWTEQGNPGATRLANNPSGIPDWAKSNSSANSSNSPFEGELVQCVTIDSLQLTRLDFMKVDVEGYETLVIEGAMNTIRQCFPVIAMEVYQDHYGHSSLEHTKEKFAALLECGYQVEQIDGPDFLFLPTNMDEREYVIM